MKQTQIQKPKLKNIAVYESDHNIFMTILQSLKETQANCFTELLKLHPKYADAKTFLITKPK